MSKEAVAAFPFRYMDASDPRADSDGYFQPMGCTDCIQHDRRLRTAMWFRSKGFSSKRIKALLPWSNFKVWVDDGSCKINRK